MTCCLLSGSPAQDSHRLHFVDADKSVQLKPADARSDWWPSEKFQASPVKNTGKEALSLEAASVNSGTNIYLEAEMANSFLFVGCSEPMVTSIKENNSLSVDIGFRLHTINKIKLHNDWEEPKQILWHYVTCSALCIYSTEVPSLRDSGRGPSGFLWASKWLFSWITVLVFCQTTFCITIIHWMA